MSILTEHPIFLTFAISEKLQKLCGNIQTDDPTILQKLDDVLFEVKNNPTSYSVMDLIIIETAIDCIKEEDTIFLNHVEDVIRQERKSND
jgi:hypothetical protein